MSSAADRRMRGARNRLVDLLGLGRPTPLIDLPVLVLPGTLGPDDPALPADQPVIVPYGGAATVVVTESEPGVTYGVRTGDDPGAAKPVVEATGNGGRLDLVVPRIDRSVTFGVRATTRHARTADLLGTGEVKIGLDRSLPFTVAGFDAGPVLVDYGTRVTVVLARSQEAVSYSLVVRRPGDTAADDRLQAVAGDVVPAGKLGDGGPIEFVSDPLPEDCVLRVRADRAYGKAQRQATLMATSIGVAVRADRARAVAIGPTVSEHRGTPVVTVTAAQAGVRYELVIGAIPDAGFLRNPPVDSATVAVDADGSALRVGLPVLGRQWRTVPGHVPTGAGGKGTGSDLAIRTPPLTADSTIVVRAVKEHGEGEGAFESAVPLATPVVALVRPAADPPLRIEAAIEGGAVRGLRMRGGQPGVFYAIAAGRQALGELYVHQLDPEDAARNKGVGRLSVGIDLAIAADLSTAAPPPVPRLDAALAMPVTLSIEARRATTGLRRALAAEITIAAPPPIKVAPDRLAASGTATVTIDQARQGSSYALLVDGEARGEATSGSSGRVSLATGAIPAGARVELKIIDPAVGAIEMVRRIVVPVQVG